MPAHSIETLVGLSITKREGGERDRIIYRIVCYRARYFPYKIVRYLKII